MNPRTIILILSINLAAGCSGADDPVSRSRQEPIVGGQLDPGHLPVGLVLQIGTQGYTSCTGTLIGPKTVLTAKHCVVGGPSAWFQLQDKVASSKEVYYSKLLQLHPTEDVALVLLKDPVVDHSNATSSKPAAVKPMKIVTASEPPKMNMKISLIGFGRTDEGKPSDGKKRFGSNQITTILPGTFWFWSSSNVCYGDSGGPSTVTAYGGEKVIGVHSQKAGICGTGGQDVRVDKVQPWICANSSDVVSCISSGKCASDKECDDGNPCTLDICRPTVGCVYWNECGDAGAMGTDSGVPTPKPQVDAGTPKPQADSGTPKPKADAGVPSPDGGQEPSTGSGSCPPAMPDIYIECSLASGGAGSPAAPLPILLALWVILRRRA